MLLTAFSQDFDFYHFPLEVNGKVLDNGFEQYFQIGKQNFKTVSFHQEGKFVLHPGIINRV